MVSRKAWWWATELCRFATWLALLPRAEKSGLLSPVETWACRSFAWLRSCSMVCSIRFCWASVPIVLVLMGRWPRSLDLHERGEHVVDRRQHVSRRGVHVLVHGQVGELLVDVDAAHAGGAGGERRLQAALERRIVGGRGGGAGGLAEHLRGVARERHGRCAGEISRRGER